MREHPFRGNQTQIGMAHPSVLSSTSSLFPSLLFFPISNDLHTLYSGSRKEQSPSLVPSYPAGELPSPSASPLPCTEVAPIPNDFIFSIL